MVDFVESRLLPKPATNRQQSEFDSLLRSTLSPIRSTLSPVCTRPKQHTVDFVSSVYEAKATHGRLCLQCVRGQNNTRSTLSPVCTRPKQHTVDFVSSVYEAKATHGRLCRLPTSCTASCICHSFRVEFNFVASVYWALLFISNSSLIHFGELANILDPHH